MTILEFPKLDWGQHPPTEPDAARVRRARREDVEQVYNDILQVMKQLERTYTTVYPWMIQSRLPYYRAEQSLRRDMVTLYLEGRLIRVGGLGSRKGYRLPNVVERVAFESIGRFPFGAEAA